MFFKSIALKMLTHKIKHLGKSEQKSAMFEQRHIYLQHNPTCHQCPIPENLFFFFFNNLESILTVTEALRWLQCKCVNDCD